MWQHPRPMDIPRVEGYEIGRLLGAGGCGRVYLATDTKGGRVAVKVFHGLAVNRKLLARMNARLAEGGWPQGVLPLLHADLDGRPAVEVTPWIGTGDPAADPEPAERSLQALMAEHPGPGSWPLVRSLARALAALHDRRVAHGNLKPGNIFIGPGGEPLIADWALGNMPGIGRFDFTDAVLYQPPEQLADAGGYTEERGYRWDVFAFGVLAYRLLTGRFPRCHDTFAMVAPAVGEHRRDGIQVDLLQLAGHLAQFPEVGWPDEPRNSLEAGFRKLITACLEIDPRQRPADMREVAAGFERAENEAAAEAGRERLLDECRHARRRAWRALFACLAFATAAVVMAGLWHLASAALRAEKSARQTEAGDLTCRLERAVADRDETVSRETAARRALAHEAEVANSRLLKSRQLGDLLFRWAMESGYRKLPPLDGREQRLQVLEQYYEVFLTQTAAMEEMADLHRHARLQLAEIALSAGDAAKAEERLNLALKAWDGQTVDGPLQLRVAGDRLILALLHQESGSERAADAFQQARAALGEVPPAVGGDRLRHLVAVLDYHEAKLLAGAGRDQPALEQIHRATVALNDLVRERPDCAVLRSELASCFLSSASIIEGLGLLGDAANIRIDALNTLLEIYKKNPTDFGLRLDLAGCYGAISETALLAGDVSGASAASKEAMKLLEKLAAEQPDNAVVAERMAANLGITASILGDSGKSAEALEKFESGIRMLESIRAAKPDDPMVAFRLAWLRWQKGRTLGGSGKRGEEITHLTSAVALLTTLEAAGGHASPPLEQIQRSLAYLLSDLGHARQMAGDLAAAREAFAEAQAYWQRLLETHSDREEYRDGEEWCRQRLAELKPK
jgi:tetratricopeptide (TPR) repeat protein